MRTLTLALLITTQAFAQPPAPADPVPAQPPAAPDAPAPTPPATPVAPGEHRPAPAPPAVIVPKPGAIIPEAQAVFDRAIAAYRGAKSYSESVLVTLSQAASGLPEGTEPPVNQASSTRFHWAGADHFTFSTRDIALYRNGKQATVSVKVLGEYTQRDFQDADKGFFNNMVELSPTYQAITSAEPGHSIGRAVSITKVVAEELNGIKGKRLIGTGYPPLPGFELVSPITLFFADDTGLLRQATYDLKAIMQSQIDRSRAMSPGSPAVTLDKFSITTDWTEAAIDTDPLGIDPALTFTPGPSDHKVDDFNTADGEDSAQYKLLGTPAPQFTATTFSGRPLALSDVKGRVVMLQFWASAEPASTLALTVFNSMDIVYRPQGVVMIGINQDHATMATQSRQIAAAKGAAFPQITDSDKAISNAYRVAMVPCTILIDKEGIIRSISSGYDDTVQIETAAKLDKLLRGEPLPKTVKPAPFTTPAQLKRDKPAEPAAPAEEPKKP